MIEASSIEVGKNIMRTIGDDYRNDRLQGHMRLRARLSEIKWNKNIEIRFL